MSSPSSCLEVERDVSPGPVAEVVQTVESWDCEIRLWLCLWRTEGQVVEMEGKRVGTGGGRRNMSGFCR